jgi:hypothetical protein
MPLRRTKRSDGRQRPRWKDGSHAKVENTDAEQSRCDGLAVEHDPLDEPLETVQSLLEMNDEPRVSTRDRPARTGADARYVKFPRGAPRRGDFKLRPTAPYSKNHAASREAAQLRRERPYPTPAPTGALAITPASASSSSSASLTPSSPHRISRLCSPNIGAGRRGRGFASVRRQAGAGCG